MPPIVEHLKHLQFLLKEITVDQVMRESVVTVKATELFSRVVEIMIENEIRHLPVVDEKGGLMGVVTQRDVYRLVSPRKLRGDEERIGADKIVFKDSYYPREALDEFVLYDVMSKNPLSVKRGAPLGESFRLMAEHAIGCLPIVDNLNRVVGICTRTDILSFTAAVYKMKF